MKTLAVYKSKRGTIEDCAKIVVSRVKGGADLVRFYPSDCAWKH